MVRYRHNLRLTEGSLDYDGFKDVANLSFDGEIPHAPFVGLEICLSEMVTFTMSHVKFLVAEQIYETSSHIDFFEVDAQRTHSDNWVDRDYFAARFVKYGFKLMDSDRFSEAELLDQARHIKE